MCSLTIEHSCAKMRGKERKKKGKRKEKETKQKKTRKKQESTETEKERNKKETRTKKEKEKNGPKGRNVDAVTVHVGKAGLERVVDSCEHLAHEHASVIVLLFLFFSFISMWRIIVNTRPTNTRVLSCSDFSFPRTPEHFGGNVQKLKINSKKSPHGS